MPALLCALALAAPATASVLERLTLRSLRERADAVALVRVLSTRPVGSGRTIKTEAIAAVERAWRGPENGTLRVRVPGGVLGGRRLIVRGAPTLVAGQRLLVFLYRDGPAWRPVGLFQGVWALDPMDPAMALPSPAAGAMLVALESGPYAIEGGPRPVAELLGDLASGGVR